MPSCTRRYWGWVCLFLLLASCTNNKGKLRIRGHFDNLAQADLLIYSPDGGMALPIDSIHILKNEFDFTTLVEDEEPHTYTIIYPNYATLSFIARSGTSIKIKGDALSLSQVRVEGADSILPADSKQGKNPLAIGKKLPKSKLIKQQKGKFLFIAFSADWDHKQSQIDYDTRRSLRDHPDSLTAFSYYLDLEPTEHNRPKTTTDTINWKTYCDYRGWQGPLLAKYGIRNVPMMILVNPQGKIVAMGSEYNRDIKPEMEKISKRL